MCFQCYIFIHPEINRKSYDLLFSMLHWVNMGQNIQNTLQGFLKFSFLHEYNTMVTDSCDTYYSSKQKAGSKILKFRIERELWIVLANVQKQLIYKWFNWGFQKCLEVHIKNLWRGLLSRKGPRKGFHQKCLQVEFVKFVRTTILEDNPKVKAQ